MADTKKQEELKRKVRRIFSNRTHKFVGFKQFTIEVEESQQKYRTIVAPYEPTIIEIEKLINHQVQEAITKIKSEAKDIGFGNGVMVSLSAIEAIEKEYRNE